MKRGVTALSQRSYWAAMAHHTYRYWRDDPASLGLGQVLVYQVGRVGSTAMGRALRGCGEELCVYNVHTLTTDGLRVAEKAARRHWPEQPSSVKRLCRSRYLRRRIRRGSSGRRWKVVTPVRDPIARNVSFFMMNLERYAGPDFPAREAEVMGDERWLRELERLYLEVFDDHGTPVTFFDRELRLVFEVDVYAREFPRADGWGVYHGPTADVLVVKLESLDECGAAAFRRFLGIPRFRIGHDSATANTQRAELNRWFRNSALLPRSYLDRMYRSRYVGHFYSDEEIQGFYDRWSRGPARAARR